MKKEDMPWDFSIGSEKGKCITHDYPMKQESEDRHRNETEPPGQ
jgi:hypothetical protein